MKTLNLKRLSLPKIAVLATGLTVSIMVATMSPQAAQAFPNKQGECTLCHGTGTISGTVTAVPSMSMVMASATYTVLVTPPANAATTGDTGFWIANSDAAGTTGTTTGVYGGATGTAAATYTATMTAPAAAGTYYYKVWSEHGTTSDGVVNFALYSITVEATPPVTTPPVTTPPVSSARISNLSVRHGTVGTRVTIRGTDFGTPGSVTFGANTAKTSSWTSTAIVVTVPSSSNVVTVFSRTAVTVPVWYRHSEDFSVTVTPEGAVASNAVNFRLDSSNEHGHHVRHAGDSR